MPLTDLPLDQLRAYRPEVRRPADLEQSLVDPAAVILSQNRVVTLTLRDGKTIHGRLLNQDTQSIQLLDTQSLLHGESAILPDILHMQAE